VSRYLVSEHPQGSEEWKLARAGKATGSRAGDILAKIKTGEAAARRDYRVQLVTERLTGVPVENGFVSKDMEWGIEQEPFARMAYEEATGAIVNEAGFLYLPDIQSGCSVDGLIAGGGLFEAKCPKSATHISYLLAKRIPPAYEPQLIHNLWITGEPFADFVSFDPRMPAHLQLFRARMERDEALIREHEVEVLTFLVGVDELVSQLGRLV
jgi:YqaJ-like viral recombinase domain